MVRDSRTRLKISSDIGLVYKRVLLDQFSLDSGPKNYFLLLRNNFLVSAEQRDRIRRRQRVEMEKQMKEIADQAGASKDQFDEAMKLAKTVLEKKDDSNVESAVAAVAAANQNAENQGEEGSSGQADQIEEELD